MGVHHIDHYTIEASNLAATKQFYCGLLGLYEGYRPDLPFPGAWLYCENDLPTVHVMDLQGSSGEAVAGTGKFNHVSFACTGAEEVRSRLESAAIDYKVVVLPNGKTQFFMKDPDGVSVELIFPADETRQEDRDAMLARFGKDYLL